MRTLVVRAAAAALLVSCRGTGRVAPETATVITASESLELDRPGVDLCPDRDGFLLLEASGARVLRFSTDLVPVETIPLAERVVSPRGIRADRYSLFIHDDNALHRVLRDRLTQSVWVNNVAVSGFAVYALGEALISDAGRGVVWHKRMFGESMEFMDQNDVVRPGPLAELPEGRFALLGGAGMLHTFNRAGIIDARRQVPAGCDGMVADVGGNVYVFQKGGNVVWGLGGPATGKFLLAEVKSISAAAMLADRLLILDNGGRILVYDLPGS